MWLPVATRWDGALPLPEYGGRFRLSAAAAGLEVAASFPLRADARIPAAPPGARVDGLWTHDVAECFIVGEEGDYLEIELGAGGHFLLLSFDGPRRQVDAHETLALDVRWQAQAGSFHSAVTVPWALVPRAPRALNAFAIFGDVHLAHAPLPGAAPDFHQPDRYPAVTLERPD